MNAHDLISQLSIISDPHQAWKVDHKLTDILFLTICAVIAAQKTENKLHWKLDVAMREDEYRIRRNVGAEVLAGFRHIAVNLLNNTKTFKAGLKRKQKKAAMDEYTLSG